LDTVRLERLGKLLVLGIVLVLIVASLWFLMSFWPGENIPEGSDFVLGPVTTSGDGTGAHILCRPGQTMREMGFGLS